MPSKTETSILFVITVVPAEDGPVRRALIGTMHAEAYHTFRNTCHLTDCEPADVRECCRAIHRDGSLEYFVWTHDPTATETMGLMHLVAAECIDAAQMARVLDHGKRAT